MPNAAPPGPWSAEDEAAPDGARRQLLQQAACMATAWAASGAVPAAQGTPQTYARARLVTPQGDAFLASQLKGGEPHLFNYPFVASPVFLLMLAQAVPASEQRTQGQQRYASPAGVGPGQRIVAYSAICSHKLMYPTPAISFIGLRPGQGPEPAQVIHCCGDDTRYDPAQGARVLAGPAPQPLAAVLLEWDAKTDELFATGVRGGEMFDAFFEKYAFKLEMELGRRARAPTGPQAVVQPASRYSRQWQRCAA